MSILEFALMALATVLAFIPTTLTMAAAMAITTAVYVWQRRRALAPGAMASAPTRP